MLGTTLTQGVAATSIPTHPAQAKTKQLHPGIQPTRNTTVCVTAALDLGTEQDTSPHRGGSCLSCPRFSDLEALVLPGALQHWHGGCTNPAAPGGLCQGPSPHPGAARRTWLGQHCRRVHPHAPGKGKGLCSPRCFFPPHSQSWRQVVKPSASTNPSPHRETQRTQGLRGGPRGLLHPTRSCCIPHVAAAPTAQHSPLPWEEAYKGRVPCRVIGWMLIS